MEKLIYPPTVFSYNWDDLPDGTRDPRHGVEGRVIPYECYRRAVQHCKVGDLLVQFVSPPGTGRVTYRITRIDETGVYGVMIENTVRELRLSDVI